MNRKILSQGDRDGACFLYSLANCVQCLTGTAVSKEEWREMIVGLDAPMVSDFLTSSRGTTRIDDDDTKIARLMRSCLIRLRRGARFEVGLVYQVDASFDPADYLFKRSVLIVDDEEHWFCVVDSYRSKVFVACSAAASEGCQERVTTNLKRTYNDSFSISQLAMHRKRAFRVVLRD